MKSAFVKIRIAQADKDRLGVFADETGKTVSEILRRAIEDTMRGHIAGEQRRKAIARLRWSTNLMLAAFETRPIDVLRLSNVAAQVRSDASKVLA